MATRPLFTALVTHLGKIAVLTGTALAPGCVVDLGSGPSGSNAGAGSANGDGDTFSSSGGGPSGVSTGGQSWGDGGSSVGGYAGTGSTSAAGGGTGTGSNTGSGGASGQPMPFKGVAINHDCGDVSLLGATWFYNWGMGTDCSPTNGAQYVPMVWGAGAVDNVNQAVEDGHSTLLGFNEPDMPGQANMSVSAALALWPQLEATGLRLGSPATASSPEGEAWIADFIEQAEGQGRRVDFVAVHWYGWGSGGCDDIDAHFTGYMERILSHGYPVWLTEWGCYDESASDVEDFYDEAVAWMSARPEIERYAWFLTRGVPEDPAWNAQRLVDSGGNLTALGQAYQGSQATR